MFSRSSSTVSAPPPSEINPSRAISPPLAAIMPSRRGRPDRVDAMRAAVRATTRAISVEPATRRLAHGAYRMISGIVKVISFNRISYSEYIVVLKKTGSAAARTVKVN